MSEENEVLEEQEEIPAPKKRRGYKSTSKPITGKIKSDDFTQAVADIQNDSYVSGEQVAEILTQTMQQAYLEWSYPGLFKDKDSSDPAKDLIKCEVDFSNSYSKFNIYDIKTVTNEDDIVDDAYQISLEDAKEIDSGAKLGDTVKIKFDVTKLDKTYVRRVKQLFQSKLKEASKTAILSVYQDKIGDLIEGTVTRIEPDGNTYELNFGKAQGFLRRGNKLPGDRFVVGDKVLVHLSDVSDKSNPPSLVISRTSKEFVEKLLERYVPEIQEGIVKIKACEREPGKRTKIFVESVNPNIDPVGTCIGPESSRIRSAFDQLGNEKVDIIHYYMNKALQVIEAMKPAVVIGLTCPEDFFDPNVHYEELEQDRDYEYPKITCVVNNGNQGVAIGSGGVNVRLASRITHCTISVLQSDDAIASGTKYLMTADILRMVKGLSGEVADIKEEEPSVEDEEFTEEVHDEEVVPTAPVDVKEEPVAEKEPVEEASPVVTPVEEPKEEASAKEETKAEEETVAPVVDAVKAAKEETVAKEAAKKEEAPVEHVEIKNKPRISLEELEEALSSKKGPSETRSYRKKFKKNDEDKTVAPSEASKVEAMPIYTEEELQQMEAQDNAEDENYDDDLDLDQYDSDEYYDHH